MYIRPNRFLKNGAFNTEYDSERRFCREYDSLDKDNSIKIEEAIITDKKNKDEVEDLPVTKEKEAISKASNNSSQNENLLTDKSRF